MPEHATYKSDGTQANSEPGSWMLYGAAGYTGTLMAEHTRQRGHQPVLAGRSAPSVTALAERLGLPSRELSLDDPAALTAALADVRLVLNAAGPLAEACLRAGVHRLRPHDPRHQPDRHDPCTSTARRKAVKGHAVGLAADAREESTP